MCGFAGFWTRERAADDVGVVLGCMTDAVAHRGPDDSGQWRDADAGVALGHRRLSILDLSPEGHQPMASASGRYVVVYNGEVYNFAGVRRELERSGRSFRGHSDTEVLLAAVEQWGLVEAVRRFTGMFSFALWDRAERALHLVRDRLGEKPLYYGWAGPTFVFGSELKALRAHPHWRGEIDRAAVALLLQYSYIPAPWSIYHGIRKAIPGTILTLRDGPPGTDPETTVYWSAREAATRALRDPLRATAEEATDQLEALLGEVVRDEMVSDVPLGAFLSGGVDSSTIVALMQRASTRPVRTFTIGFNEHGYDEAAHARAVAAHLGTDHTELYVTAEQALAVVPRLPSMYDEPFADSSQIPTFLVAQMARRHVTVSLSGDGGDELFGGYERYFWTERAWRGLSRVPLPVRRLLAGGIDTLPPQRWNSLVDTLSAALPSARRPRQFGERLQRVGRMLRATSHAAVYDDLISLWPESEAVALGGAGRERHAVAAADRVPSAPDRLHQMMLLDTVTYLPDDILVKVDRASMAVSLECRAPMLDHRVAEFAWRLPLELKVRGSQGKWLLRQLLYRHVPRELVDRPKMGFSVPLDSWLRGPLREWAAALLDPARLRREGFFDAAAVTRAWDDHQLRGVNRQTRLWPVLMFQAWHEQQ